MRPTYLTLLLAALSHPGLAAELTVRVTGIQVSAGEIGCALFSGQQGFPLDAKVAKVQWLAADRNGVACTFRGIPAGTYAVAVSHDLNKNRRTDVKMFGIPTEDWGVSNNIRHRMRAPNFQEAAFQVRDAEPQAIEIKVGR